MISVVIPTYGHFDYAREAVLSAINSRDDVVAIVVDDGSKDWNTDWLQDIPSDRFVLHRFEENKGTTQCWNFGINESDRIGCEYVCLSNSDVIFPNQCFESMIEAIDRGFSLIGPLTNAPGHSIEQNIKLYMPHYELTDDKSHIEKVNEELREKYKGEAIPLFPINGFCWLGRTDFFITNDLLDEDTFPRAGQEDDFQRRVLNDRQAIIKDGGTRIPKFGYILDTFVFHYRGVSRYNMDEGSYRKD